MTPTNHRVAAWRIVAFWQRVPLRIYNLLFFIFLIAPIAIVVVASFTADNAIAVPYSGFSLRWYRRLIEYRPFIDSLMTSLYVALSSAVVAMFLAVPAALALARSRSAFAVGLTTFLLAPIAIPALVIGFSLLYFLSALGVGVSYLALLIAHTVVSIPYVMRTVLAVYRGVGTNFEEAASVLGANGWQRFRYVTLPLIRPGIFAGALFAVLISLDNLPVSYFFGTANVTTLPVVMLSYLENQIDPAIAAIGTVQMLIAVGLLLLVERVYGLGTLNA